MVHLSKLHPIVLLCFCSTALTSSGWVRITTLSLGTVHHLSSATVIESLLIFLRIIPLKIILGSWELNPGHRARSLNATTVLWRPPYLNCLYIMPAGSEFLALYYCLLRSHGHHRDNRQEQDFIDLRLIALRNKKIINLLRVVVHLLG